mgnify:CR=1 FL=1
MVTTNLQSVLVTVIPKNRNTAISLSDILTRLDNATMREVRRDLLIYFPRELEALLNNMTSGCEIDGQYHKLRIVLGRKGIPLFYLGKNEEDLGFLEEHY